MAGLYSLIFERQFKLRDLARAMRFLFPRLRRSQPKSPAWRDQPDFAEFEPKEFAETRVYEPKEPHDTLPPSPRGDVEVTEDALDTLPADLQEEFVKSVARATQERSDKAPRTPQ
jgi:hypothetical protein